MRRRRQRRALAPGRGTLALGMTATAAFGAVVLLELRRVWRRGSAPALRDTDHPILAAEEAVSETARVARAGYREVSTRENSMFNLLTSFAVLAVPFGVGMGLTLDESALLLDLEDVYWSREGLLSVQITLTVIAMLGALALGLRFLRRGEQLVLEPHPASP